MSNKNKHAIALGKKGGSVKSERKSKSSAENGKKGGRPRQSVCLQCGVKGHSTCNKD